MDIGKIRQDARLAKNISLDSAAQETNIRKTYLEAIEQNDFAMLHGDVFVKGVIRTYGNYLGLDGAQLVDEYKTTSMGTNSVTNNNTIRESRNVKVRPSFKSNRDIGSGNGDEHRVLYIFACILAVVFLAGGGFYYYLSQTGQAFSIPFPFYFNSDSKVSEKKNVAKNNHAEDVKNENDLNQKHSEEAKHPVNEAENKPDSEKGLDNKSLSVASSNTAARDNGTTNLRITSTGRCWLRVTDQKGVVLFEGNLLKGERKMFTSHSSIVMRIGNLKELQIEYNGKLLPFEDSQEVVTRIYTPVNENDALVK